MGRRRALKHTLSDARGLAEAADRLASERKKMARECGEPNSDSDDEEDEEEEDDDEESDASRSRSRSCSGSDTSAVSEDSGRVSSSCPGEDGSGTPHNKARSPSASPRSPSATPHGGQRDTASARYKDPTRASHATDGAAHPSRQARNPPVSAMNCRPMRNTRTPHAQSTDSSSTESPSSASYSDKQDGRFRGPASVSSPSLNPTAGVGGGRRGVRGERGERGAKGGDRGGDGEVGRRCRLTPRSGGGSNWTRPREIDPLPLAHGLSQSSKGSPGGNSPGVNSHSSAYPHSSPRTPKQSPRRLSTPQSPPRSPQSPQAARSRQVGQSAKIPQSSEGSRRSAGSLAKQSGPPQSDRAPPPTGDPTPEAPQDLDVTGEAGEASTAAARLSGIPQLSDEAGSHGGGVISGEGVRGSGDATFLALTATPSAEPSTAPPTAPSAEPSTAPPDGGWLGRLWGSRAPKAVTASDSTPHGTVATTVAASASAPSAGSVPVRPPAEPPPHFPSTATSAFVGAEITDPTVGAGGLMSDWSIAQVGVWLGEIGFPQYAAPFRDNHIDGKALLLLGKEDLTDIGVRSVGHRLAILRSRDELTAGT